MGVGSFVELYLTYFAWGFYDVLWDLLLYFGIVFIPFGYYLLLVLLEGKFKPMKKWYIKAGAVFTLCALSETLQYFDIYALARVFDPMDYVMYALGVVLAIFIDRILFKRLFEFWN